MGSPAASLDRRPKPEVGHNVPNSMWRINANLTVELAITAFKLKYTGSILGYVWSLIKPLLIFGMMYVIFALFLLKNRVAAGENFTVELLLAVIVWTFFVDSTQTAVSAIAGNGHMIRKAYFPRWILVISSTLSASMTFGVNSALILVIGFPLGWFQIGLHSLAAPLLLVELYVLILGISLLLSSLFVFYRDLGHVWEIIIQLLFYSSAIVFPFSLIPAHYRVLVAMSPTAQIIEDLRHALVTTKAPWVVDILGGLYVVPILAVCLIFALGAYVFHRLTPRFGESL
jgi:ABC-2 type transport system permease protein